MGWLDEDNYLYLGNRREDMILSGGANVYPAEVEAAMQEHPDVRSVAVIGLPHDDLGHTVHAVVEADEDAVRGRLCCPSLPSELLATRFPGHSSTRISLSATKPANSAGAPSEPSGLPRILKVDRGVLLRLTALRRTHETHHGQQQRAGGDQAEDGFRVGHVAAPVPPGEREDGEDHGPHDHRDPDQRQRDLVISAL